MSVGSLTAPLQMVKGAMQSFDPSPLSAYKASFLETCLTSSTLKFGTFTLKSGRVSPYFFNTALFHKAALIRALSTAYAQTLIQHTPALEFDVLFGPAYKGIPLATATVDKLAELDPHRFSEVSYSFDRKEAKDHGEGGVIVGGGLQGKRVVIIDDVVTAGTAKRQAIDLIRREGGTLVGIIVALDRQEKMPASAGQDDEDERPRESAIGQIRNEYGVPVLSILTLEDLIGGMKSLGREEDAKACEAYWTKYKASDGISMKQGEP
ncbi:orotate phosphoribosyltransferase [Ptychographa xylographoides]|nr:orotate phosphoribosyltransferase [Ptychographa xylographoides]